MFHGVVKPSSTRSEHVWKDAASVVHEVSHQQKLYMEAKRRRDPNHAQKNQLHDDVIAITTCVLHRRFCQPFTAIDHKNRAGDPVTRR